MEKKLIQNAIRQLKDNQEGDNWLDESFRRKCCCQTYSGS